MARTITTEEEWDALPVGTLARVRYIEHDDDGNDVDEGKSMTILRVEGDVRTNIGDYMLAGGRYWSEVWVWEQGAAVVDVATVLPEPQYVGDETEEGAAADAIAIVDDAIRRHAQRVKDIGNTPYSEFVKIPETALPAKTPSQDIVAALLAAGWTPPVVHPEGVQVWTISGIPTGGVADGTQAYLSLPDGPRDKQNRGDIWLAEPKVTVNFELPYRRVD